MPAEHLMGPLAALSRHRPRKAFQSLRPRTSALCPWSRVALRIPSAPRASMVWCPWQSRERIRFRRRLHRGSNEV